ncbi:hypothetical protein LDENG_00244740 [Lucifuga dentata]|nr:hypothetical protein LDENG_00244740 [Lucifuga dentata]
MHSFLNQVQDEYANVLSENPSATSWTDIAKVCLAQIILFNQCREGEMASMSLHVFLSRDISNPHEDVDLVLSEVEKKTLQTFLKNCYKEQTMSTSSNSVDSKNAVCSRHAC